MIYYKRYNDEFYDFDKAYDLIEKNGLKDVVMRTNNKWACPSRVEVTWDMIHENHKNMSIPVWAAKSNTWSLWVPDYDKQELVDNAGDWIQDELGFVLDSRFWKEENMSISDWWKQLDDNILIEEDYIEIMNFLKKSGRLRNWKERNKEYYSSETD